MNLSLFNIWCWTKVKNVIGSRLVLQSHSLLLLEQTGANIRGLFIFIRYLFAILNPLEVQKTTLSSPLLKCRSNWQTQGAGRRERGNTTWRGVELQLCAKLVGKKKLRNWFFLVLLWRSLTNKVIFCFFAQCEKLNDEVAESWPWETETARMFKEKLNHSPSLI